MSPLARVASLAAIATGAFVVTAVPAVAEPSTSNTPSPQATSPESGAASGSETPSASETPSGSVTPSPSGSVSTQDTQYLQQAHQTNLAEISAGKLAQQKGNSQTVKNLGAKFVTDHTKLDNSLRSVAQSLNVSLPSTPNAAQQAVFKQLQARSGTQFDNLFVTSQFAGHTVAMQANENEIATGSNQMVVKLARDSEPVIESHHQALEAAARQLGITLPTASPVPSASLVPSESVTPLETASPTSTNS
jgi:predicted outer membrane protein